MQLPRSLIAVTFVGALVAACGGSPAATQGPGATTSNGGQATSSAGPGQTTSGGNGGGQYGSVKFSISGPFDKTGEYPFIPAGSMFAGPTGAVLSFSPGDTSDALLSILVNADGSVVVSYVGTDGQVPAAECTTSDWNMQAQSGSGKFDCKAAMSITGSGAMVQGGTIKGEFTART